MKKNKKKIMVYSLYPNNFQSFFNEYNRNDILKKKFTLSLYKDSKYPFFGKLKRLFIRLIRPYDVVMSDYPTRLLDSSKSFSIAMGHGTAIKKFPAENELNDKNKFNLIATIKRARYYIVTSPRQEKLELRSPSLDKINKNHYMSLGLPKNDLLFSYAHGNKHSRKENILYMPTFRDNDQYLSISPSKAIKIANLLRSKGAHLYVRFHPFKANFNFQEIPKDCLDVITNITSKQLNEDEILKKCDLLITDYSSVSLKYLILNRPILFYLYDYEEYDQSRGIEFDYFNSKISPGDVCLTFDTLLESIEEFFSGKYFTDEWCSRREDCLHSHYSYPDGQASIRIWNLIEEELGD